MSAEALPADEQTSARPHVSLQRVNVSNEGRLIVPSALACELKVLDARSGRRIALPRLRACTKHLSLGCINQRCFLVLACQSLLFPRHVEREHHPDQHF